MYSVAEMQRRQDDRHAAHNVQGSHVQSVVRAGASLADWPTKLGRGHDLARRYNRDETFNKFDAKQWAETVKQLDEVMKEWEQAVEAADDKKLAAEASTIAHVGTHNAYHIGQIVFVRVVRVGRTLLSAPAHKWVRPERS